MFQNQETMGDPIILQSQETKTNPIKESNEYYESEI